MSGRRTEISGVCPGGRRRQLKHDVTDDQERRAPEAERRENSKTGIAHDQTPTGRDDKLSPQRTRGDLCKNGANLNWPLKQ